MSAKSRPNKLDPYAERLDEWAAEGKTLQQMRDQLALDGCMVALSSLSEFLSRRRQSRMEAELFSTIATGGRMIKQLDSAFSANPAPQMEQLIQISKTLVMSLQVKGATDPDLLKLADSMLQTVLTYMSGQTKAELERRKLELSESKYRDQVAERDRRIQAEIDKAKAAPGGLTTETLEKIERELKLF